MSEAGVGATEVPQTPSPISSQLQEAGLFIDGVQPFRGDGKDLVQAPRLVQMVRLDPEKATQQVIDAAKLCDSFNERMKPALPGIEDPAAIIIGDVHNIILKPVPVGDYSFSAYSLISSLSQGEHTADKLNTIHNTKQQFRTIKGEEFSETLECVQQMVKLLNASPDKLYAYTYFARRKLENMIQKQKISSGLTNLSIAELKNHPKGKQANSVLKQQLAKHDRIKSFLAALEKSTLLKQKPAHIENHINSLIN